MKYKFVVVAAICWVLLLLVGISWFLRFDQTPGASAQTPRRLGSALPGSGVKGGMGELRVFLHPRCPCSAATLAQLKKVLAAAESTVRVTVYLYRPKSSQPAWSAGGLRAAAEGLPSAVILDDLDGEEAERFGALTSGQVVLYGPDGALRFSGGVTDGRGQFGQSHAADQLKAALSEMHRAPSEVVAPVYGCPIRTPGEKR